MIIKRFDLGYKSIAVSCRCRDYSKVALVLEHKLCVQRTLIVRRYRSQHTCSSVHGNNVVHNGFAAHNTIECQLFLDEQQTLPAHHVAARIQRNWRYGDLQAHGAIIERLWFWRFLFGRFFHSFFFSSVARFMARLANRVPDISLCIDAARSAVLIRMTTRQFKAKALRASRRHARFGSVAQQRSGQHRAHFVGW